MSKLKEKWDSPVHNCDLCLTSIFEYGEFLDAKTIYGPWGLICPKCASSSVSVNGVEKEMTVGIGQIYKLDDEGDWAKVGDLNGQPYRRTKES